MTLEEFKNELSLSGVYYHHANITSHYTKDYKPWANIKGQRYAAFNNVSEMYNYMVKDDYGVPNKVFNTEEELDAYEDSEDYDNLINSIYKKD